MHLTMGGGGCHTPNEMKNTVMYLLVMTFSILHVTKYLVYEKFSNWKLWNRKYFTTIPGEISPMKCRQNRLQMKLNNFEKPSTSKIKYYSIHYKAELNLYAQFQPALYVTPSCLNFRFNSNILTSNMQNIHVFTKF